MPFSRPRAPRGLLCLTVVSLFTFVISGQTPTFTFQGRLTDTSMPATGTYQMQFALYDAATAGTQIGATVENTAVSVADGLFTVSLDFGSSAFPAADRFLEIRVRRPGDPTYTPLSPRQKITSSPYALQSVSATNFSGSLSGEVVGSQGNTFVDNILGKTRNQIAIATDVVQGATPNNTAGKLVLRGGSGEFSAGNITSTGLTVTGNAGIGVISPASKLSVGGGVQIGSDSDACSAVKAGTIRFNGSSLQYCTGTAWTLVSTAGRLSPLPDADAATWPSPVGLEKRLAAINELQKENDRLKHKLAQQQDQIEKLNAKAAELAVLIQMVCGQLKEVTLCKVDK
jgi:hypothetical protein